MGYKMGWSDLVPEGEYEVTVDKVGYASTKNGTEYINVELLIRSDIEQKRGGARLWDKCWRSKDTGEWNLGRLNKIWNAAGFEKNTELELEELFDRLAGVDVLAVVKHYDDDYTGGIVDKVAYYKPTALKPRVQRDFTEMEQGGSEDQDELPF